MLTASITLIILISLDLVLRLIEAGRENTTLQAINSRLADINSKLGYSPDRALVEALKESSETHQRFSDTLLEAVMSDHENYRQHKINQAESATQPAPQVASRPSYNVGETLTPMPVSRVVMAEGADTVG